MIRIHDGWMSGGKAPEVVAFVTEGSYGKEVRVFGGACLKLSMHPHSGWWYDSDHHLIPSFIANMVAQVGGFYFLEAPSSGGDHLKRTIRHRVIVPRSWALHMLDLFVSLRGWAESDVVTYEKAFRISYGGHLKVRTEHLWRGVYEVDAPQGPIVETPLRFEWNEADKWLYIEGEKAFESATPPLKIQPEPGKPILECAALPIIRIGGPIKTGSPEACCIAPEPPLGAKASWDCDMGLPDGYWDSLGEPPEASGEPSGETEPSTAS